MNKLTWIIIGLVGAAAVGSIILLQGPFSKGSADNSGPNDASQKAQALSPLPSSHLVTLDTNFGLIQFETYDADAPKTVENFVTLARKGFYNGLTFHRVIKGFMIQGGDPNCGARASSGPCGAGGPGYVFEDELNPSAASYQAGYKKGVVAMANAGPNTNGSQFFIMLEDVALPRNYTIFGKVVAGQDVVEAIGGVATDKNDRPISEVAINSVSVEEK